MLETRRYESMQILKVGKLFGFYVAHTLHNVIQVRAKVQMFRNKEGDTPKVCLLKYRLRYE